MAIDPGPAEQTMGGFKGRRNAQGRYVALAASSGDAGGTIEGLSVELLDGTASHGNRVRVTADATYAIGPKEQAAPRHWEMGDDLRINGVPVTQLDVGAAPSGGPAWGGGKGTSDPDVVRLDGQEPRHERADRYYHMRGDAWLSSSAGWADLTTKAQQSQLVYWAWHNCSSRFTRAWAIILSGAISGEFAYPGSRRRRGELCTITSGDGSITEEAYIHLVYGEGGDTWVTLEPVGFSFGSGYVDNFYGGTIVGNDSGATATFGNSRELETSPKLWRVDQDRSSVPYNYSTSSTNGGGQYFYRARDENDADPAGSRMEYVNYAPDVSPGTWQLIGNVIDFSGDFRKDQVYRNNELMLSFDDMESSYFWEHPTEQGMAPRPSFELASHRSVGISLYLGEMYVDTDTRILVLCDQETLVGSTHIEIQFPEAWTEHADGAVTIDAELYQGAFENLTGKYLALIDGATVKFEGVQV